MKSHSKKSCSLDRRPHPHGSKVDATLNWMVCNDGRWEDGPLRLLLDHEYVLP
ncbi:MAG: hypothetical protein ACLGPL_07835 [Acidobacteriota bacterium]